MGVDIGDDVYRTRMALGAYAVYRARNLARHVGGFNEEDALRAMQQGLREAAEGHDKAMECVRSVWTKRGREE